MAFMDLQPRKPRSFLVDHAMIWAGLILTLMTFRRSVDEITGPASVLGALGFTTLFVLLGLLLIHLPAIWARGRGSRLTQLATPLFILLTLSYLNLSFQSYFIQPGATGVAILGQLLVLICLACRMI